uniref:Uncharacterized protein n=1 Tax=Acrobeloides nanus TaxID=290746 RepID=A0A914CI50_9BILA
MLTIIVVKGLETTTNYGVNHVRDEDMEDTCDFDENGCLLPIDEDESKVEIMTEYVKYPILTKSANRFVPIFLFYFVY